MKIQEIAKQYHDTICGSMLTMDQICDSCGKEVFTTIRVEHDSMDKAKDISICIDCYGDMYRLWKEKKPGKICPV